MARGIAHGVGVMLWFYAMARIPISEVTAIGYTTPIFTAVGAIIIFREKVRHRRFIAIAVGFVGALIILRPGFQEISAGSAAQFFAAILFAISYLFVKSLTKTQSSTDILVMLTIFCTLTLMPGALLNWRTPTVEELTWLAFVAVLATVGHYCLTRALACAPITVTQPLSFLQLVWAIVFGFLIFDEVPDLWVCAGAVIIVGAITYLAHRESLAKTTANKNIN